MADFDGTTFLTGANAGFIAELYTRFLEDPKAVDESWRRFFSEIGDDASAVLIERQRPVWPQPAAPPPAHDATAATAVQGAGVRPARPDLVLAVELVAPL